MPLRFFTETRTGEIQSRLANDVGGVQSRRHRHREQRHSATSSIAISTVIAMLLIDWRLTALSLGLLPFFLYLTYPRRQGPPRGQHARPRSRSPT